MIKAAIFDLGSVLATEEWPLVYAKIADESKISKEKVKGIIRPLFRKWCVSEIDEEGFWRKFEVQAEVKLSKEFTKDFCSKTYKKWSRDIKESWEILIELQMKGVRLALLSNITETHVLANKEMGRFKRLRDIGFEVFVWSCKEGLRKPDPKIYEVMLKKLNLPAKACVFVDDKLANIETAKELGMYGIHFQSPEQLREDLIKLGVL